RDHCQRLIERQWTQPVGAREQRLSIHVLHHQARPVFDKKHLVKRRDVRMAQLALHPAFIHETAPKLRILRARSQRLEGAPDAGAALLDEVYLAHSARTEQLDHAVASDPGGERDGHAPYIT